MRPVNANIDIQFHLHLRPVAFTGFHLPTCCCASCQSLLALAYVVLTSSVIHDAFSFTYWTFSIHIEPCVYFTQSYLHYPGITYQSSSLPYHPASPPSFCSFSDFLSLPTHSLPPFESIPLHPTITLQQHPAHDLTLHALTDQRFFSKFQRALPVSKCRPKLRASQPHNQLLTVERSLLRSSLPPAVPNAVARSLRMRALASDTNLAGARQEVAVLNLTKTSQKIKPFHRLVLTASSGPSRGSLSAMPKRISGRTRVARIRRIGRSRACWWLGL